MPHKDYTDSSTVKAIWHEGTSMFVEFIKSGVYEYEDVPLSMYNQAVQAESIGKWVIQRLVKGSFKWKKV